MLALDQIKTIAEDIMYDDMVLAMATPLLTPEADDVDQRIVFAETLAQTVILVTLDKLSAYIKDIPSTSQMSEQIISLYTNEMVAGLEDMLDN